MAPPRKRDDSEYTAGVLIAQVDFSYTDGISSHSPLIAANRMFSVPE
jgi:hypothetical protein